MVNLVSCTDKNKLFKPPWVKVVIACRAWAGLGQLLEREERPQLWKDSSNLEPRWGHFEPRTEEFAITSTNIG